MLKTLVNSMFYAFCSHLDAFSSLLTVEIVWTFRTTCILFAAGKTITDLCAVQPQARVNKQQKVRKRGCF